MRPTVNGKGSYDVIVPKFQQLVSQRGTKDYYVRGTFTRENLDFADDVEHLASLGSAMFRWNRPADRWTTPSPSRRETCPQWRQNTRSWPGSCRGGRT